MSIRCALGLHRARSMPRWNGGYYFSTCTRCGRDLVRTPFEGWHPVPRGFRVVWSPTPPPGMRSATLTAEPTPVVSPSPASAAPALRDTPPPPLPSEVDSAARDSDLPIAEVLRLLREAELEAPEPARAPESAEPPPLELEAPEIAPGMEPDAAEAEPAPLQLEPPDAVSQIDGDAESASERPAAAKRVVFDDDFMKEDPEFWGSPLAPPAIPQSSDAASPAEPEAKAGEPIVAEPDAPAAEPIVAEPQSHDANLADEPDVPVAAEPEAEPASETGVETEPSVQTDSPDAEPEGKPLTLADEPALEDQAEPDPASAPDASGASIEALTEASPEAVAEPEPETDALELPASSELAAIAEPSPAQAEPPSQEPTLTQVPGAAAASAPSAEPVSTRSAASWPSAAPSQDRAPIVGMDGQVRARMPIGLVIAGALILGAIAVLLFTRVPHPQPSGPRTAQSVIAARSAPAIAGQPAYVTVGLLTCHASSVLQARAVRIFSRGDKVQVLAREPGWASVMKDGRQCWVVDRYISSIRPAGRGWLRD